jgi:hypothetical protein
MKKQFTWITVLAMMVLLLFGCKQKEPPSFATWCVLVDMSGVRENPETRQQYSKNFALIMDSVKPGDAIVVAKITESSINEPDYIANHTFAVFHPTTDNDLYLAEEQRKFEIDFDSVKKRIYKKVSGFILNNPRITGTTDIISAIHVAGNIFNKYDNPDKNLVILSDMEQYSNDYKFTSENLNEERIAQIIESERRKPAGIPGLSGVKVFVAGAKSKDTDRFFRIKNFWMAYFDACRATLMKEDYGAAIISLE